MSNIRDTSAALASNLGWSEVQATFEKGFLQITNFDDGKVYIVVRNDISGAVAPLTFSRAEFVEILKIVAVNEIAEILGITSDMVEKPS